MKLSTAFDGGVAQPYAADGDTVTFDLRPGQKILHVHVSDLPRPLRVELCMDPAKASVLVAGGLIVSGDAETFDVVPLEPAGDQRWAATVEAPEGALWVATRYPYGFQRLMRLMADTAAAPHGRWRVFRRGGRSVPMLEFGDVGTAERIHYFIAGEDAWETAGTWVADAIVRALAGDDDLTAALRRRGAIRVVPLVSPFSATQPAPSYTTPDGRSIYGAATWADPLPPPEVAILRDLVDRTIRRGRLGLMLTMHSWQSARPVSSMETLITAGEHTLSPARQAWAKGLLAAINEGVPRAEWHLAERIWHPGLARDWTLAHHDAATFRVEITTDGQGPDAFADTGRRYLANLAAVDDWTGVMGNNTG